MKKLLFLGIVALTGCLWADRTANQGWVAKNFAPSNLVGRVEALEGAPAPVESDPTFTAWKTNASVAVGAGASASGAGAVQIGTGTNAAGNTLKFRGYTLVGADGKIPSDRIPTIMELDPAFYAWRDSKNVEAGYCAVAGTGGIAIGNEAKAQSVESISIGDTCIANGNAAIAIGWGAYVDVENAVQIGLGSNITPNTLQFRDYTVVGSDGKIPADRLPAMSESDPWFSGWCQAEKVQIGFGASASEAGVVIGKGAYATGDGISIGKDSNVMYGTAVAVGQTAKAYAEGAVQLGTGTNSGANTLQFKEYQLVDANGKIPAERLTASAVLTAIQAMTAEQKAALKTALGL